LIGKFIKIKKYYIHKLIPILRSLLLKEKYVVTVLSSTVLPTPMRHTDKGLECFLLLVLSGGFGMLADGEVPF